MSEEFGRDPFELLKALSEEELAISADPYFRAQLSGTAGLRRQVEAFALYSGMLGDGPILDWGCRHAPSACLIRNQLGPGIELHGCDIHDSEFPAFHGYAGLDFKQLDDPCALPYGDDSFAAVISNGVLEHVADLDASVSEIARVLEPGGVFIITFLPNRLSYSEWQARRSGRMHHSRLFRPAEVRDLLRPTGLKVTEAGYHQVLPSMISVARRGRAGSALQRFGDRVYGLNSLAEKTPLRFVAANLYAIARMPA